MTLSGWRHARAAETATFERQICDDSLPLHDLCRGAASVANARRPSTVTRCAPTSYIASPLVTHWPESCVYTLARAE